MEKEFQNQDFEPEEVPEGVPDMTLAIFLVRHIDNPCESEVAPGQRENIREFYLKEAELRLKGMTNSEARDYLESKIKEYKK